MFGMMCSLAAAGIFLIAATLLELPVSTTHSIVGAVIGFGLVSHGRNAIQWYGIAKAPNFPITGVAGIVISWVFSPVCSGILASIFFLCARTFVLRHRNSYIRSWISLPIWVFLTVSIDVLFMVLSGAKVCTEARGLRGCVLLAWCCIGGALALPLALLPLTHSHPFACSPARPT